MNMVCGRCSSDLEAMEVNRTFIRVICLTCARKLDAFEAMAQRLSAVLPDKQTTPAVAEPAPDAPAAPTE
jgi:hypothetical protein